jgi:hypothetical protein
VSGVRLRFRDRWRHLRRRPGRPVLRWSHPGRLGARLQDVEHIADAGLLGGDTAPHHTVYNRAYAASGGGDQPGIPALTPVPQELAATIEARFRTTGVSLPDD